MEIALILFCIASILAILLCDAAAQCIDEEDDG